MASLAYKVVQMFEEAVAERIGAKYGVAVESCTAAIFLSCLSCKVAGHDVWIPPFTYISVPQAVIHAGGRVRWSGREWVGSYWLEPYDIVDSAKCFDKGSYDGGLHCVSFHIKKPCPIGRGGMILTDDAEKANWLRKMRYEGRAGLPYARERVELCGWNAYLTPDAAGRGLMILETLPDVIPPDGEVYPDLRKMPLFKNQDPALSPGLQSIHDFVGFCLGINRLNGSVEHVVRVAVGIRDAARQRGDFVHADFVRDGLAKVGVLLEDTPTGTTWRRVSHVKGGGGDEHAG